MKTLLVTMCAILLGLTSCGGKTCGQICDDCRAERAWCTTHVDCDTSSCDPCKQCSAQER